MTLRTVDSDLRIVNGNLFIVEGLEAVRQRAIQHLRFFIGESFRSPAEGNPFFVDVIGTFDDAGLAAQADAGSLVSAIPEITGADVMRYHVNSNRSLVVMLRVHTIFGDVEMEV